MESITTMDGELMEKPNKLVCTDLVSDESEEERYREQLMREEAEAEEQFWREAMLNYDYERGDWKY